MTLRTVPAPERLARLLALVPWLASHDGVTVSEAAAHFRISDEQLVDDLNLLICSGLPGYGPEHLVDIQFWDDDGVIHVLDPQTLGAPMRLTSEEITALLVGLRVLAQVPGDHDRGALLSAAAKLERVGGGLGAENVTVAIAGGGEHAKALDLAIRNSRCVHITYAGLTRDDVTQRTIIPAAVQVGEGYTYVEAWCQLAGAWRTFRLDRILTCDLGDPALPPAPPVSREVPTETVLLELDPSSWWVADVHGGRILATTGDVRRVSMEVATLEWAARLVLSQGGYARALEPADLRVRVRDLAEAALRGYRA